MRVKPASRSLTMLLAGVMCVLSWLPRPAAAQQVVRDLTINFVEVVRLSNLRSQVKAYVTVTDLNGAPVTGLEAVPDSFAVTEDGVPKTQFSVEKATEGVAIVVVVDTTSSMGQALAAAKDAADSFVASTGPEDQVALYEFQEEPSLLVDLTLDHNKVRNAIRDLQLVDKWTCVYSAANTAVQKTMQVPQGRRAVVLLTDGKDQRDGKPCSSITADDLIALAYKQRVPIYIIGLGKDIDEPALRRIAEKTGGAYWGAAEAQNLSAAYQQVAELLQGQYLISYESTASAGDRGLQIRVDHQGLQALHAVSITIPVPPITPTPPPTETPAPATTPMPPPPVDWYRDWRVLLAAGGALLLVLALAVIAIRRRASGAWSPEPEPVTPEPGPPTKDPEDTLDQDQDDLTMDIQIDNQPVATLTVVRSEKLPEGQSWDLLGHNLTIGRNPESDVELTDRSVSRSHGRLEYRNREQEFYVYDDGSTYGTRVNDEIVTPQGKRLADGDLLQLGPRTVLRYARLRPSTKRNPADGDATDDWATDERTRDYSS